MSDTYNIDVLRKPTDEPLLFRTPLPTPVEPKTLEPSYGKVARDIFFLHNPVVNLIRSAQEAENPPVKGYAVYDDEAFTEPYRTQYADRFVNSRSPQDTSRIISQIEAENQARETEAASGVFGTAMGIAAGGLDPLTFLLPGGALVKGARLGEGLLRSGRNVAFAGAAQTAVQESLLHATQQTRTKEESLYNIGAATLLAGFLGAGASRFIRAGEREALMHAFETERAALSGGPAPMGGARAAGSQATDVRTAELAPIMPAFISTPYEAAKRGLDIAAEKTAGIPGVPSVIRGIKTVMELPETIALRGNPKMRMDTSPSLVARRYSADLAESVLHTTDAEQGIAPSRFVPLNREVQMVLSRAESDMSENLKRLHSELVFGENKMGAGVRAWIENKFGGERMEWPDFLEEVDWAGRDGDTHAIPQIAEAAKVVRAWLEHGKTIAKERAGIDISGEPLGAKSYGPRYPDRTAMIDDKPGFIEKAVNSLRRDQENKAQIQQDIQTKWDMLKSTKAEKGKLEGRAQTSRKRLADIESRLAEIDLMAGKTGSRVDAVQARAEAVKEAAAEMKGFLDDLKDLNPTPEVTRQIKELEQGIKELEAQAPAMTERDLAAIDKEEQGGILTGNMRKVANTALGKRKPREVPSFWKWVLEQGGVKDTGGDLAKVIDPEDAMIRTKGNKRKYLINEGGLQWDILQRRLGEEFPELAPQYLGNKDMPTDAFGDEIMQALRDSLEGKEPEWFLANKWDENERFIHEQASMINEVSGRAGVQLKSLEDVANFLHGEHPGITEADFNAFMKEIEGSGAGLDTSAAVSDLRNFIGIRKGTRKIFAASVRDARAKAATAKAGAGREGARASEAGIANKRVRGRLGILEDRSRVAARQSGMLEALRGGADKDEAIIRADIEDMIQRWEGNTTVGAKAAITAREKSKLPSQTSVMGRDPSKPRLKSADKMIEKTVKDILKEDKQKSLEELKFEAEKIHNNYMSTPDGRLYESEVGSIPKGFHKGADYGPMRGALMARRNPMTDEELHPYILKNPIQNTLKYLRQMMSDVGMIERFGDTEGKLAEQAINEDYARILEGITNPRERRKIESRKASDIRDFAAMRDRIKGVYAWTPEGFMKDAGRLAESLKYINLGQLSGGFGIAQIPDLIGVSFRRALGDTFKDGFAPYLAHLAGAATNIQKAQYAELRAMGIGTEAREMARSMQDAALSDVHHGTSATEKVLRLSGKAVFMASGAPMITDAARMIAAPAIMHNIIRSSKEIAEGTASPKTIRDMAAAGLDADRARRAWEQFSTHGEAGEGGTMLPNLRDWTDREAANFFEAAVMRDLDIAILLPGEEKPLMLSLPVFDLLGQFKTFTASSTTRILLANLQRRDAMALQGLISSVAAGALGYTAYTIASGGKLHDNWQGFVKEGLDRSSIFGWFSEANATGAKLTGGRADLYRLIGADKPLSRYQSRNMMGTLLGPTAGLIENLSGITYAASAGEWTSSDTHTLRRLMFFQNWAYFRRLLDEVEKGFNQNFGIEERAAK